ncbi:MAG TPA: hypothetical protein VFS57_10850 [Gemmatimonadaceae bacterium]|nr:hypothetical protein [Gemmatimonadaceae bacterium]
MPAIRTGEGIPMGDVRFHSFDRSNPIPSDVVTRVARDLEAEMPHHMLGNYLSVKPHVLASSQFVTLMSHSGVYVGLASGNVYAENGVEFFYIETLLLSESLHDRHMSYLQVASLFSCLYRARGNVPATVAAKTYNGRAYVLVRKLATLCNAPFYPAISGPNVSELVERATRIAGVLSPELVFDAEHGIVRGGGGAVSARFWPEVPRTREPDVNEFFTTRMTSSDRVLCVIDTSSAQAQRRIVEVFVEGRIS